MIVNEFHDFENLKVPLYFNLYPQDVFMIMLILYMLTDDFTMLLHFKQYDATRSQKFQGSPEYIKEDTTCVFIFATWF